MEDPRLDISIGADSSGAVSAFDNLDNSVGKLDKSVVDFGNKIQKPVTNIGLQLYAQELARSIGLSGAASQAATVLATGITYLGSSFKFLTGPTGLAISAFIALSGAVYKAISYQKDHTKTTEEQAAALKKLYDDSDTLADGLDDYAAKIKGLSPVLIELSEATKKVNEQNRFALLVSEGKQLEAIDNLIRSKKDLINANNEEIQSNLDEAKSFSGHVESGQLAADVNKILIDQNTRLSQEIDAENKKRLEIKANIAAQAKGYKDLADQMKIEGQAADDNAKKQEDAQKKISDALRREEEYRRRLYRESLAFVKSIVDSRYNMEIAAYHGTGAQAAVAAKMVQDAYGNAYLTMTKGAGDAFAAMAVDGEKFGKSMDQVLKNLVKSFISAIVEMEIRWAASKFMKAVGLGIVPTSEMPMTKAAVGLNTVVSRPTLLLVGEGGEDEEVRVTPRSQAQIASGSGIGGGNVSVTVVNNISGGGKIDTARLADQIGKQVISRIRGQGDLDFVRR